MDSENRDPTAEQTWQLPAFQKRTAPNTGGFVPPTPRSACLVGSDFIAGRRYGTERPLPAAAGSGRVCIARPGRPSGTGRTYRPAVSLGDHDNYDAVEAASGCIAGGTLAVIHPLTRFA